MLVILLPMSGCFDGAIGEAEGNEEDQTSTIDESVNQEPLIYGGVSNCIGECYMNGQSYYSRVSYANLFTVDPDGNIANFGIDWDNDFEIDWSFPWDWNSSYTEQDTDFNYSLIQINEPANPNNPDDHCYSEYFNLISEDNRGLKEISPMKWRFDWDEEQEVCLFGPRS